MSENPQQALVAYASSLRLELASGLRTDLWYGAVDGIALTLSPIGVNSASAGLRVTARLPHELDLGLVVEPAGVMSSNDGVYATGDAAFDGLFVVRSAEGEEHESVARILDATVRAGACALEAVGQVRLTDVSVASLLPYHAAASTWPRDVRATLALARHIGALAGELAAPLPLRRSGVAERVAHIASDRGLSLVANRFVLRGELAGTAVDLRVRCRAHSSNGWFDADGYSPSVGLTLDARFAEPLGAGLTLRRATLADRAKDWVGIRDVHTGDAAFDRAWTLRAADEPAALALLHDEARALLDALAATGLQFALDDDGLAGHAPWDLTPDAFATLLDALERLRTTLRPVHHHGPYR